MHAVGACGQGDVDSVVYHQTCAVAGAYCPQLCCEVIKFTPAEVFFAELKRDAEGWRVTRQRVEHFIAYLGEMARRDQAAVADQVKLEIGRRTERTIQVWFRGRSRL